MNPMPTGLRAKEALLHGALKAHQSLVVAYSGGVDSTYLAHAAHQVLGTGALIATAASPSVARSELSEAARVAGARGWNHVVVETHELDRAEYRRNGSDRCYWCKTELFEVLEPLAARLGAPVAVGTNADDVGDYRPGIAAAAERDVLTPLLDAGLGKAEIRALSLAASLPTAEKPAGPCLASRLAYGIEVTPERLRRVDEAEEFVRSLGFHELRVRDHGDVARLEVPRAQIAEVAARAEEISTRLGELGFRYVTLDLRGFRSGSLNEVLPPTVLKIGGATAARWGR